MDSLDSTAIIVGAALLSGILLVWVVQSFFADRRSDALELVAQQLGFTYEEDGVPFQEAPEIRLLATGRDGEFSNVLHGATAGMETSIFDYKYTTGSGKYSTTHTQTVAAYRLPHPVASFWLHPITWEDKVGIWFGGQNIDFDDDSGFSNRYRLQAGDESAVHQAFTPAVRSYFETLPENDWHIETSEGWMLVYEDECRVPPEAISDLLQATSNLVAGLKELLSSQSSDNFAKP